MNKKLLFVFNPLSGKGLIRQHLLEIIDILTKGGYDVTAHPTQAPGDAAEIVRAYGASMDLVVCSGGDGTLDETVTGIMETSPGTAVGYIPAGSTNDFAAGLGISSDMEQAARDIVNGRDFLCDVGAFEDMYFVYIAAFGMFTEVSYQTDQALKNALGHVAYLMEAGKKVFDIPSYHLTLNADGHHFEGNYTYGMITNARSVGGIRNITGPAVDLNDGLFEVTLIRTPTNPVDVPDIIQTLLNPGQRSEMVDRFKARRIDILSNTEIAWTLDGEYGKTHRRVRIENLNKALHILRAQ